MDQWNTLVSVTRAIVFSDIHFQNMTSSGIACAFIFDFISMLKIWRVFCAATVDKGLHKSVPGSIPASPFVSIVVMNKSQVGGGRSVLVRLPFKAMTLLAGFMMAESAEMGLRMGLVGSERSMMTTWFVSPTFSRTHMNLSDSIVSDAKPMLDALMPTLVS